MKTSQQQNAPVAVLLGRTNTGKSRLYNALCGRPEALVSDVEHLTRDWRETTIDLGRTHIRLRDTAGLNDDSDKLSRLIKEQTLEQIASADILVFVVDARVGLMPADQEFAHLIRRSGKPVVLVINKMDTVLGKKSWMEFSGLGFARNALISAERHEGLYELRVSIAQALVQASIVDESAHQDGRHTAPVVADFQDDVADAANPAAVTEPADATGERGENASQTGDDDEIRVESGERSAKKGRGSAAAVDQQTVLTAVVCGLSNSGKSTLINRLTKSERLLVDERQGTTREPVGQSLRLGGTEYQIYDTCGFVRRGDVLQYLADAKTDRLIDNADLTLYLIDVTRAITRSDLRKISELIEAGQNPLIVCNKIDMIDASARIAVAEVVERQLAKLGFETTPMWISAQEGRGLRSLARKLNAIHRETGAHFATSRLTKILDRAVKQRPPPTIDSRRIRLRYAHQGGTRPLLIIIHGKQTNLLNQSYQRYLSKTFRDQLGLRWSIPRIIFSTDTNPYSTAIRS